MKYATKIVIASSKIILDANDPTSYHNLHQAETPFSNSAIGIGYGMIETEETPSTSSSYRSI